MLPILATGASQNDKNHSKFVSISLNQTYLLIANHFGGLRWDSGKVLSDFWSTSPKFDDFGPKISLIWPTGASPDNKNHSKYVFKPSKQTYIPITNHFGGLRWDSGKVLSDFWSTSSKYEDFWPYILPILDTGASKNDKNHSKYVFIPPNQTYIPITNNFGGLRCDSGKVLSDFWSTSSKYEDFWPKILPILATGASKNNKNHSKYVFISFNQTSLPITNHFCGLTWDTGKLLSDFWGTSPKICEF